MAGGHMLLKFFAVCEQLLLPFIALKGHLQRCCLFTQQLFGEQQPIAVKQAH
jgi:hypothetical protein